MAALNWGGYYSDVEYEMGGQRCFSDDTWNEYLLVKCDCNQHDSMMMDGNRYSSCNDARYSSPQECKFEGTGWKSINTYSGGVSSNAYCISRNEIGAIGVCAFCSCSDDAGVCEWTDWYQHYNAFSDNAVYREYICFEQTDYEGDSGYSWTCKELDHEIEYGCDEDYYVSEISGVDVACTECPTKTTTEYGSQSCSVDNASAASQPVQRTCTQDTTSYVGVARSASDCFVTGSKSCGAWTATDDCCATSCKSGYTLKDCACNCTTDCTAVSNSSSTQSCTRSCSVSGGSCYYSGSYQRCNGKYTAGGCSSAGATCSGCSSWGDCEGGTRYIKCNAGTYWNGSSCATCTAGYYCPGFDYTAETSLSNGSGRNSCSTDTGGSYPNSGAGATAKSQCYTSCSKPCTQTSISNACSVSHGSSSTSGTQYYGGSCSASASTCSITLNWCNDGYYKSGNSCGKCPSDYPLTDKTGSCSSETSINGCWRYCNASDVPNSYTREGWKEYGGSNTCKATSCNEGYYLSSGVCRPQSELGSGYYCPAGNTGAGQCYKSCSKACTQQSCPANATCTHGSTSTSGTQYYGGSCSASASTCSITITCKAGYYKNSSNTCTACGNGKYCPGDNNQYDCKNKPANSAYVGSATSNSCPWECNPGYYGSSANGNTSCANCGSGNFCTGGTHRQSCASVVPSSAPTPSNITSLSSGSWSDYEHGASISDCLCDWYFSDSTRVQYLNQSACSGGPAGNNYTAYSWCRTGYYAADPLGWNNWYTSCKACTNGPANSYYTSYSTPSTMYAVESNCPWCCNANYYLDDSSCKPCSGVSYTETGTDTENITGGTRTRSKSRTCYRSTSSACSTSASACSGTSSCGSWSYGSWSYSCSSGYYLSGTTCEICTNPYYCPGDNKRYDCPDPYTYAPASYPANYYSPTISSVSYAGGNGNTSPDNCTKLYWFDSTRGKFFEYMSYSSSTGHYVTTGDIGWGATKPGYYLKYKLFCGTYAYYSTTDVCPAGSFCPGKDYVYCDSSNQSTVWTETFGLEPCPSSHPNSAAGNNSKNTCYTSCPSKTGYTLTGGVDYYGTTDTCTYSANTYTCSAGQYLNGATCTACESGYYCPGGTWTYNGGIQGRNTCPSPTDSTFTSLYSWSSDGVWDDIYSCWASGSTTNDSGAIKLVCMASDTNGTYKDSCRTNGGTTCNPGYYFDGIAHRGSFEAVVSGSCQLVPAGKYFAGGEITDFNTAQVPATCPSTYPNSDAGTSSASYCYKNVTLTGTQTPCDKPNNSTEYACDTCQVGTCTYADYYSATDSVCTPANCEQSVKPGSVVCEVNYYTTGTACELCKNAPGNAHYTGVSSSSSCPWECDSGYNQTSDNQCGQFCTSGITHIKTSTGLSIPLYSSARTSPAINIKWNNQVCYGSLVSGTASGAINVDVGGTKYHTTH